MRQRSHFTRLTGIASILLLFPGCSGDAADSGDAGDAGEQPIAQTETAASVDTVVSTETPSTPAAAAAAIAPEPANACALLPAAQMAAIAGKAVRDSVAMLLRGPGIVTVSQCNYGTLTNPAAATLMFRGYEASEDPASASRSVRETLAGSGIAVQDIEDLGAVSFWGANQLHVFTDRGWYIVVSPEPGVGLPQAREMARLAMENL